MAARGIAAPEAGDAYTRAYILSQQVGETPQLFHALWGLFRFHGAQAQLHTTGELCQQLFQLAQRQHDLALVLTAHLALRMNASAAPIFSPCWPRRMARQGSPKLA
jgi:hypothetical protein